MSRGRSHVAPESGISPTRPKASRNDAPSAAIRRSQAKASEAPAPAATPLIAPTIGFVKRDASPGSAGCSARGSPRRAAAASGSSRSRRSWPAQNARPAPVRTTARTDSIGGEALECRQQLLLERDRQRVERVGAVEGDRRDARRPISRRRSATARSGRRRPGRRTRRAGRRRARTRGGRRARRPRRSSPRRTRRRALANSSSPGRRAPAIRRCRSGRPTRTRPAPPSSDASLSQDLREEDPRGVPAVAGVATRSGAARRRPRRSRRRPPTRRRGCGAPLLDVGRRATPHESEMIAVDDHVEAAGAGGA